MKATRRATALALLAALCGGAALVAPRSALRRSAARTRAAPRLAAAPLADILEQPTAAGGARAQRFVLVGGKGGVGKTSTASALAVRCAESGLRTLVASTDPAHSLGDALQLSLAGGAPVRVPGLETLDALEIDPTEAIGKFRAALAAFRPSDLGLGGMAEQLVGQLGLEDFADILDEPPPGLDELLALSEVVDLATGARARREAGGGAGLRAGAGQAKEIELDDFDARLRARGDAGATTVASRGDAGAGALSEGSETFPYDRIILDTAPTGAAAEGARSGGRRAGDHGLTALGRGAARGVRAGQSARRDSARSERARRPSACDSLARRPRSATHLPPSPPPLATRAPSTTPRRHRHAGHTLRLLALPTFLESLLSKIGALRSRLGGALAAAAALGLVGNGIEAKLERAAGELEALRQKVAGLKALLADGAACEFVVVTVPTDVALAETERLLAALAEQRVRVRHLVVNQMVLPDVAPAYLGRWVAARARACAGCAWLWLCVRD
jgi:arsenite-transporting ATPase